MPTQLFSQTNTEEEREAEHDLQQDMDNVIDWEQELETIMNEFPNPVQLFNR